MGPLNDTFSAKCRFQWSQFNLGTDGAWWLLEAKYSNNMKEHLLHPHRWCDFVLQGLQSGKAPSLKLQTGECISVCRD